MQHSIHQWSWPNNSLHFASLQICFSSSFTGHWTGVHCTVIEGFSTSDIAQVSAVQGPCPTVNRWSCLFVISLCFPCVLSSSRLFLPTRRRRPWLCLACAECLRRCLCLRMWLFLIIPHLHFQAFFQCNGQVEACVYAMLPMDIVAMVLHNHSNDDCLLWKPGRKPVLTPLIKKGEVCVLRVCVVDIILSKETVVGFGFWLWNTLS